MIPNYTHVLLPTDPELSAGLKFVALRTVPSTYASCDEYISDSNMSPSDSPCVITVEYNGSHTIDTIVTTRDSHKDAI